jgi:N-acetylneuraminic acid mutarotase
MNHSLQHTLALTLALLALASCTENGTPTEPVTGRDQPTTTELAVATNSWTEKAIMPTGRVYLAAAVVNNSLHQPILYTIGGGRESGETMAAVEAYDFETNAWSTKAPLPVNLHSTNGAGVIAGKIYVSGGRDVNDIDDGFPRKSLYVYDPVTDSWSRKADMPLPSMDGVTGVIDGRLYVLTGNWENGFFQYDPSTDSWSSLPKCPAVHFRGAGAVINGKFYVAGGEKFSLNGPYAIKKLHVYDPVTNTWSAKALMPRGVYLAAGARLRGQLYVVGGIGTDLRARRLVQAYDPVANTWALKAPLPTWRSGLAASNFVLNGQQGLVAIGGYGGLGIRWLRSNDVYTP